jgi:hypothetical protein
MLFNQPKSKNFGNPIDNYGEKVQLSISRDLKELLELEKIIPQEPMEICIRRIISERKAFLSELKPLKRE